MHKQARQWQLYLCVPATLPTHTPAACDTNKACHTASAPASLDVVEGEGGLAGAPDELVQPKVGQLGVGDAVGAARQQHVLRLQVAVDDLYVLGDGRGQLRWGEVGVGWGFRCGGSGGRQQAAAAESRASCAQAHHGVELVQVGQPLGHLVRPAHRVLHG